MKKAIWILVPLLLLSIFAVAFAQENNTTNANQGAASEQAAQDLNESDAGSFKIGMQQLKVMFAFNQEKKANLELELARLRLIQAKIAAKKNNTVALQNAIDKHEKLMEKIRARINATSNKGGNVTGLERAIEVHNRRITALNNILQNTNLTEEQRAKIEMKLGRAENVTAKLTALESGLEARKAGNITKNTTESEEQQSENQTE